MIDDHGQRIVHDEHHMLVTALREADIDSAERILEGHIRRTRRRLAAHPQLFGDTRAARPTAPRQKGPSWPSQ
jgi:DNA-binding GntR family transcriptional regulator